VVANWVGALVGLSPPGTAGLVIAALAARGNRK
ncbi:MAG: hypothetical protein UX63_C0016G0041, partial [Microgenomates group bacterium GW2011_GWB1_46_7]